MQKGIIVEIFVFDVITGMYVSLHTGTEPAGTGRTAQARADFRSAPVMAQFKALQTFAILLYLPIFWIQVVLECIF